MTCRITELNRAAATKVREILDRPDAEAFDIRDVYDFDPWDIFPAIYGTYSSEFDDCAIEVLCDLRDVHRRRVDLAADMLREMLCTANLCEYGTSPRTCFPTMEFREILPELIERWQAFSKANWESDR